MATIQTIGTTGRDYSTLQAWEDGVPATPTGGYEGHCYNDSEFTAPVLIDGHTTSSTNYIKLTAASGQSFQDHASVRTNPLIYDQTKGVGLTVDDADGDYAIRVNNPHVTVDRLQIKRTAAFYTSSEYTVDFQSPATSSSYLKDCIIGKTFSGTAHIVRIRDSNIINCLVYDSGATASTNAVQLLEFGTIINCTVVRIGTAGGTGVNRTYTNNLNTVKNTASFNWTTNFDSTTGWSGSTGYNCTNSATAPGSNNQTSKTFSNQFTSTTNDFSLKSGADCIGTGNTDATNAPNDITGFTRGTTTAGDIGAWEFSSSGSTVTGDFDSDGVSSVTGAGASTASTAFSAAGTATPTGRGASTAASAGSIAGTATAIGVSASTSPAAGSISATATPIGVGASSARGDFTATAVATAIGVGRDAASFSAADGSISATATVVGRGASTQAAAGSVTATATPIGVGASIASGAFDADATAAEGGIGGVLTMIGVGSSLTTVQAAGSISATATPIGVGAATRSGAINAAATATVIGVGTNVGGGIVSGDGSITATSSVIGVGAATQAAVVTAAASSSVIGVGRDASEAIVVTADGSITITGQATGVGASRAAGDGLITIAGIVIGDTAGATSDDEDLDGWVPRSVNQQAQQEEEEMLELVSLTLPMLLH